MEHQGVSSTSRPFRQIVRTCQEHGDYELFQQIDGVTYGTPGCIPCWRQRKIKASTKMELIPKKFIDATFEDYQPENEHAERILKSAIDYAENFEEKKRHVTCMLFLGEIGTGKTHLACSIANAIMKNGFTALYVTTMDLVKAVRSAWDDHELSESKVIQAFARPDLLILDEVGRNRGTADEKKILFEIMDKRYLLDLPCIVISNRDHDGVKDYLGRALFDRLREGGGSYHIFKWKSYRGNV